MALERLNHQSEKFIFKYFRRLYVISKQSSLVQKNIPRLDGLSKALYFSYIASIFVILVVVILINVFEYSGKLSPEVLLGLVASGVVGIALNLGAIISGWWVSRVLSNRSEQEIKRSIENATSQAIDNPMEILARATKIVAEANKDANDGFLIVALSSPLLYQDRYRDETEFVKQLLDRAENNLPTLMCCLQLDNFFSADEEKWQKSRMAEFLRALAKVTSTQINELRTQIFNFFSAILKRTEKLSTSGHKFVITPISSLPYQFVMRLRNNGTGRLSIEDWLLFFTDPEAVESTESTELIHAAYASKLSGELGRNILGRFCTSLREPRCPYSDHFLTVNDLMAGVIPTYRVLSIVPQYKNTEKSGLAETG